MAESSRRGGRKGKSVVPPTTDVSPLNIQDLDFLFDDIENTEQEVEVQPTRQQSQGTQGSTSIPSAQYRWVGDSAGRLCVVISADEATVHPVATQSIQSQEDSGEAFGQPDASNSSIQSRDYLNQLLLYIQSRDTVSSRKKARRKELKKKQSAPVVVMNQQRSS
ncbi:hypothetical protein F511_29057 [Dorcoceras hygrometricum]|uniref:Uncharacterized protein n=1 Tax=Dorcoceras hygrometricum TaxID=472368 RepID=A0A2Z7CT92_9LAMI|nr:hypothetical protein F511_29057 [Dorcoceras hygrometricum]